MSFPFITMKNVSKCCFAPIRIGSKRLKNSKHKVKIYICTKCDKRDVDIVPYEKRLDYDEPNVLE